MGALVLYPVTAMAAFTGGMSTAALYTSMMDRSDPKTAATDFTLQQSLCAVGPMIGAMVSGFSAAGLGYAAHFLLSAGVLLIGVALVAGRLTTRHAAPATPAATVSTPPLTDAG